MLMRLIVLVGIFVISGHGAVAAEALEPKVKQEMSTQDVSRAWLFLAAKQGDLAKISRLIESGSDVNARDESGMTALMFATRVG